MKLHYSILVALTCSGCVTQQTKETPAPPQDNSTTDYSTYFDYDDSSKDDSRQSSSTGQMQSKVSEPKATKAIVPKTSLKTDTKKQVTKNKVIKSKVKNDKVIKSKPVKSKKIASAPEKSVKSDSKNISSSNKTESKATQNIAPQTKLKTSTEKPEVETTAIKMDKIELENSAQVDSEQLSSTNEADVQIAKVILPQSSLEEYTEQKVMEDTIIQPDNIEFDLDKLPLKFGGTWVLDRNKDSVSKTTRCLLNSQKKNFNDGYTDSSISLQLTADTLLIKTSSAIDLTYPDIGIYIDQNAPFPLEKIFGESSILIEQNTQKITAQLLDGQKLTLKMGFWPTWPQTETHSIDFALSDFDKAYQSFQACEKL